MLVVVLYQSLRGTTRRAAEHLGRRFAESGPDVAVYPVTAFDYKALAEADLAVIGTWTDGLFGLGQRPAQLSKLNKMPDIFNKPAAVFVTYEISPKGTPAKLAGWAESKGARVVATAAFNKRHLEVGMEDFVDAALGAVSGPAPNEAPKPLDTNPDTDPINVGLSPRG